MAGQNDYALVEILNSSKIRKRFEEMLGDNASSFINSVLTAVNSNNKLKQCSSATILSAASTAATLKLPIIPSLGYAYIVPFKVQGNYQAAFQIGWKGFVQLAMRSGQYRRINASRVFEGQIKDIDFITGDPIVGERTGDNVVGYIAYFELLNGFSKTLYMTLEEMTKVLRLPRSTVNYRLKKAKLMLKKELEDWYYEDE